MFCNCKKKKKTDIMRQYSKVLTKPQINDIIDTNLRIKEVIRKIR